MDHAHSRRATTALQKLAEMDPAFASLSLWCKHRDTDGMDALEIHTDEDGNITNAVETKFELAPAYTDGATIFYGTEFAKWTLSQKMAVCAHEIMHIAFRHVNRSKKMRERLGDAFDNNIMNIATDAIINQTLLLDNYDLPRPCIILTELMEEVFGEKITAEEGLQTYDAEKLYMRLMEKRPKSPAQGGQPSDPGGDPNGKGQGQGKGKGKSQNKSAGQGEGGEEESNADRARGYAAGKGFKEDMDSRGKSRPEDAQEDNEWQQRLARALNQGRLAGRGIGKIGHMLADLPKSRTPWEVILRRIVNKAVTRLPRQSYERPTRRWLGMASDAMLRGTEVPGYEPGFVRKDGRPKIVVGCDVSGSISDQELEIFAGEIASIGKKTGSEIHVIVFDTAILSETKLDGIDFESEIKKVQFARGGGTSFVDVVNRGAELDASIIVVLTDLCGPFGPAPGKIPVVWATSYDQHPQAPFGRVIKINE